VPGILAEASSVGDANIIVEGVADEAWETWRPGGWLDHAITNLYDDGVAPGATAESDAYAVVVMQCCSGNPDPKRFGYTEQRRSVIRVHLAHALPAAPLTHYVTFDVGEAWSPPPDWRFPMKWLLAHETGHTLLGPRHSGPCPVGRTPWPILCSPLLNLYGPAAGPVTGDFVSGGLPEALRCQLTFPRNWMTLTPAPPGVGGTGTAVPPTSMPTRCPIVEFLGAPSPTPPVTSSPCPSPTPVAMPAASPTST